MTSHQHDAKQDVNMPNSTDMIEPESAPPAGNALSPRCWRETNTSSSQAMTPGNIDDLSAKNEILRQIQHANFKTNGAREILGETMENGAVAGAYLVSAVPPSQLLQEELDLVKLHRHDAAPAEKESDLEIGDLDNTRNRDTYCPAIDELQLTSTMDLTDATCVTHDLTEAILVVEPYDDAFRPVAVEFDPDAKAAPRRKRPALYDAALILMIGVVVVLVVAGVIIPLRKNGPSETEDDDLPFRKFIQSYLLNVMDFNQTELLLGHGSDSPYRKALEWISFQDPLPSTPDQHNFLQRYWSAYFYFATSAKREWGNCIPPQDDDSPTACSYVAYIEELADPANSYPVSGRTRWLSNTTECRWAGITCDGVGQITEISLQNFNLSGSFPALTGFPFLKNLVLSFNQLTGPLPANLFSSLKHVRKIRLTDNLFSGSIPDSWFHSRALNDLSLAENNLEGTLSSKVNEMKDMSYLWLSKCGLAGAIPGTLGDLNVLRSLKLNGNAFTGSIPDSLSLQHLKFLDLQDNQLTGVLPVNVAASLSSIQEFNVDRNYLEGPIPGEMWQHSDLYYFSVANNMLTGSIDSSVSNASSIVSLYLEDNFLTGTIPTEIAVLPALTKVDFSGNSFTGSVPIELCRFGEQLTLLAADCREPRDGGVVELPCSCCTLCCSSFDSRKCVSM